MPLLTDEQAFEGVYGGAHPEHPMEWLAIEDFLREQISLAMTGHVLQMYQQLNDDEWYRRTRAR